MEMDKKLIKETRTMENFKLNEKERDALDQMIKNCLSEWDREHNNWAGEDLNKAKTTLELKPAFAMYFHYFTEDAIKPFEEDRNYRYLKGLGFWNRFNAWYFRAFNQCIREIEGR